MEIDDAERERRAAKRAAKLAARRAAAAAEEAEREGLVRLLAGMPDDDHIAACVIVEALRETLHFWDDGRRSDAILYARLSDPSWMWRHYGASAAMSDALAATSGITQDADMARWLGAMASEERRELATRLAAVVHADLAWHASESDETGDAMLLAADRAIELLVNVIRARRAGQ
jgi:hypothetical protein